MTEARPDGRLEDKSLGELVAIATSSVTQLVKSELELAKLELKSDAKRAALGSTLVAAAGMLVAVGVILLSITVAYGLTALFGFSNWLAFLIVTVFYFLLAVALLLVGALRMKKLKNASRMRRTRETVKADLAMLRRGGPDDKPALAE